MRIPSFRYMGGKARLRKWLIEYFPKEGRNYVEPFVGLGNVFFLVKIELNFKEYLLNDSNPFIKILRDVNLELLPKVIEKTDFEFWKNSPLNISKIIEPRITFAGKGYKSGFSGSSGTHIGYKRENYLNMCKEAQRLLQGTYVFNYDYLKFLGLHKLTKEDFCYLDPPYYNTTAPYSNIDHSVLIERLNSMSCKYALSGYDNELYERELKYKNKYQIIRNSEIKGSNTKQYEAIVETLWTNY